MPSGAATYARPVESSETRRLLACMPEEVMRAPVENVRLRVSSQTSASGKCSKANTGSENSKLMAQCDGTTKEGKTACRRLCEVNGIASARTLGSHCTCNE